MDIGRSIIIVLVLLFYVFSNVGVRLHFSPGTQLYIPFFICLILSFRNRQYRTVVDRTCILILMIGGVLLIYRYIANISSESWQTVIRAIMPAAFVFCLPKSTTSYQTFDTYKSVRRFVDVFYILECCIAIFEYATRSFVFGWEDYSYGNGMVHYSVYDDFRSVSFLGSALGNALGVSTMMSFYIFDNTITQSRKLKLVMLGMLAVFCFNARTAIVLNAVCIALYLFKGLLLERRGNKSKYIVLAVLFAGVFLFALQSGMGSRLLNTESFEDDGSIGVRLAAFDYLSNVDWDKFLFGTSMDGIRNIMAYMNVVVLENFWLLFIFHLGIVFTVFWAVFYFKLGKQMMSAYPLYDKLVIFLLFVVGASINNSCYSSYYPLLILFLCCYTFNPSYRNDTV